MNDGRAKTKIMTKYRMMMKLRNAVHCNNFSTVITISP